MNFNTPILMILGLVLLLAYLAKVFSLFKISEIYLPSSIGSSYSIKMKMLRIITVIIGIVGIGYMTVAIGQPRKSLGYVNNNIEVNDIFLVVDVSRSMLAEDFTPNRLVVAKNKIREFISLHPTDRIGIIMFSEKAFTLLPLSTDLKLIEQSLDDINVGFLGSGTNIGDALALAVGRANQSIAKNKVIVLLTDGVSNVGVMTPVQAAEEAKKIGVKVYTIGIGQKKDAKSLKVKRGFYQRIPGGSVDLETLKTISKMTNGKSYYAGDAEALKGVLEDISKLEKTKVDVSGRIVYEEMYLKYLLIGLFLFLFSEVIRKFTLKEGV